MTLEGKLEEVNIGDVILIQGKDGNAVGYVQSISQNFVDLNPRDFFNAAGYRTHGNIFSPTYTTYYLDRFETYQVLKKKEERIKL